MNNRYCVIMGGGVGSRFWPYSRKKLPKQFIDFLGTGRTLLQMSFDRVKDIVPRSNIIVVTNENYREIVKEQLPELDDEQILLEPTRRNTAPCIAWAAFHIQAINPDATIMVSPSDHLIFNEELFRKEIVNGYKFVESHDALLTLGIKPNRPETGYGYIQVGEKSDVDGILQVKTFTEKPNIDIARIFVESGEFFWNSGIFLWSAKSIIKALHDYAPDVYCKFEAGAGTFGTSEESAFINSTFAECPNISIDFAVMEKAPNVFVSCVNFGWNDLGTWGVLYEYSPKSKEGNVTQNCNAMLYNCNNNMIAVKKNGKLIVASGLKDYIIADADDVLLICPQNEEQRIKQFVNDVKSSFGDKYQ